MVRSLQRSTEYKVVAPIVATPGRLALDRLALRCSTGRRRLILSVDRRRPVEKQTRP
jgi:hypothetical protein